MKLLAILLLFSLNALAQDPVHLTYKAAKIQPGIYEVFIYVRIDSGWHIYSSQRSNDTITFPIRITYKKNNLVKHMRIEEFGYKRMFTDTCLHTYGEGYENTLMILERVIIKNRSNETALYGDFLYLAGDVSRKTTAGTIHFMISLN